MMLKINQHTKISAIIKANSESIDVIASIAKPFNKLKNPILRRLMAPRVTISEAASIGRCSVEDFARVLKPLGFIFEDLKVAKNDYQTDLNEPVWFTSLTNSSIDEFDVRQLIASGDDPLKQIIKRYQELPVGQALCIINNFIPYPLLQVLGKKGALYHIQSKSDDLHHTWFFKSNPTFVATSKSHINMLDICTYESVLSTFANSQIVQLDVRDLPMPQPMETILEKLVTLERNQILHVFHKRVPLHLMEELENSLFEIRLCEYGREDIRLLIQRATQ